MACCKKAKAQKKASKAFGKAQKNTNKKAQHFTKVANKQAAVAGKKFEDFQNTVTDRVHEGIEKATPVLEDAASKARVKAGVLAAVAADKLNDVEVPEQAQTLAAKAGYSKRDLKKARKNAVKSANAFAKQQKKAGKKTNKGLLLTGLVVAAGSAGYAAYKASRPVEDPWKTPVKPATETKTVSPVTPQTATETKSANAAAPVTPKTVAETKPATETKAPASAPKPATAPKVVTETKASATKNTSGAAHAAPKKSADPDSDTSRREAEKKAANPAATTREKSSEEIVAQTSKAPVGKANNAAPATKAAQNSSYTNNKETTSSKLNEEGVEAKDPKKK